MTSLGMVTPRPRSLGWAKEKIRRILVTTIKLGHLLRGQHGAHAREANLTQEGDSIKQKQIFPGVGCSKAVTTAAEAEESKDEGLLMEDIIAPEGDHLRFGSFENDEIKKLWSVKLSENSTTVINEYGSNMKTSKFDPLGAIEAKYALKMSNHEASSKLTPIVEDKEESAKTKEIMMEQESKELVNSRACSMSPAKGTQEKSGLEWSSQEEIGVENEGKANVTTMHSTNWATLDDENAMTGETQEKGETHEKEKGMVGADMVSQGRSDKEGVQNFRNIKNISQGAMGRNSDRDQVQVRQSERIKAKIDTGRLNYGTITLLPKIKEAKDTTVHAYLPA
ncbi:hypothetical protein SEVIR_9G288142v4 [Setaria viridis]